MEIDPRKNGVHSLVKGLQAFRKFHDNEENIYALKDSILRSHHGLETLFKHILYRVNPVLLVSERIKAGEIVRAFEKCSRGEISTPLDEMWTVNLKDSIERLQRLKLLKGLDEEEYRLFLDSVAKLTNYRNKLQHLGLSANPDEVGRILGNALPRAIDVLEETYSHLNEMMLDPSKSRFHFRGVASLQTSSIAEDLREIFPNASSVIDLLRHDYDQLTQEAIKFFKGRTFNDQDLKLKIVDHGKVGAPPYLPELVSEGLLNFRFDSRSSLELTLLSRMRQLTEELPYTAEVRIGQPTFTRGPANTDLGIAEGSLEFEAHAMFERADAVLNLPNAQEKMAVLRRLAASIRIALRYKAHARMTDWHYECMKILEANGQLSIRFTAVPKGYGIESKDAELIGQYQSDLDEEKAPFRLHAFVEPDGSLKENYALDWSINTRGDIKFI